LQKLQLAKATLKRGSICHWQQPFGNHFAVILNLEWPPLDDVVLFSIMTSSKFPSFINNEVIRTGPNDYGFLNKDGHRPPRSSRSGTDGNPCATSVCGQGRADISSLGTNQRDPARIADCQPGRP
jgi:hypothetical protein